MRGTPNAATSAASAKKKEGAREPSGAAPRMLAFDIETTGLDRERCQVTVVCTEDFRTGERRAYEFGRVAAEGDCGLQRDRLAAALVEAFDGAESLCAFNGVAPSFPHFSQLVHEEPASEYVPARQFMQAVEDVDPEGDDLPAGQSVHDTPATPWQTYTTFRK